MSYIIENGKRVSYTIENDKVIYSDGKVAEPSVENIDIKLAYKSAVIPSIEPPIIIIPPIGAREITEKELGQLKDIEGETFKLKPGIYEGQYWLKDLNNVSFDFTGCAFKTWNVETFMLDGINNGLTFKNTIIKGTNRAFIRSDYQGTAPQSGFTIENVTMENGGPLFLMNGFFDPVKGPLGVTHNVKITNVSIKNSPNLGTAVNVLGDGHVFENIIIDRVNNDSGQHDNVFMVTGQCIMRNCKLTNHRGSLMRLTPVNLIDPENQSVIAQNIIFNSTKYGAFDLHFLDDDVIASKFFAPSNVLLENNTAGQLNTSRVWDAKLIDLYSTRSVITLRNNIGFDLVQSNGVTDIKSLVNPANIYGTTVIETGTVYKPTWQEAVADTINFKSLYKGIGAQ